MHPGQETRLITQVRDALSVAEFVRLAEELGGARIYVPRRLRDDHELVIALGMDAARRISDAIAPAWLPVPLARRERALFYEAQGLKDQQIARRIGMTRGGVQRLLNREALSCGDLSDRTEQCSNAAQLKLL